MKNGFLKQALRSIQFRKIKRKQKTNLILFAKTNRIYKTKGGDNE